MLPIGFLGNTFGWLLQLNTNPQRFQVEIEFAAGTLLLKPNLYPLFKNVDDTISGIVHSFTTPLDTKARTTNISFIYKQIPTSIVRTVRTTQMKSFHEYTQFWRP